MPVQWTIEPDRDLVTVVAEGEVTYSQLVAMIDGLRAGDAHGYRKLYDGARSLMRMTPEEVLMLGAHMRVEHERTPMGPMAAILPEVDAEILARLLGMVALADRPLRIFVNRERALKWLLALPSAPRSLEFVG
ncbi:MAG: hypothetical protein A3D94_12760 [Alphaproteobacteria bacterium RIFCSPHIGHO2_12_FULL_66_14]|jgi:hypothetical protein|nr:MAG: hypothetical protein A3D94_12760 [Alphaproteobacteria bacterium RIFCSPHIGHO2_12_FULL_66_14]